MARHGTSVKLTDKIVRSLDPPAAGNRLLYDSTVRGFALRVTARGARSFVLNYYARGVERRLTIGSYPAWSVAAARNRAKELRREVDAGGDPLVARAPAEPSKTVGDVLDLFMKRYAPEKLRRPDHYADAFDRLVKPAIGKIAITDLRRRNIVEMLDAIEDNNGAVMATRALSYLRSALNWHATRDDEFTVPIVRGMARSSSSARAGHRTHDDGEVRTLWGVFGQVGNFGLACRIMLLTACRRQEVTGMMWSELDGDTWTIPAARYKTARDHVVPLPATARAIIDAQPQTGALIFPGKGGAALSRGGNHKARIDKLAPGLTPWTVHDLRRTARPLMSRAGVRPDISERVLGHVIPGIGGVYDRFSYLGEKAAALEDLATLIDRIVNPPPPNVVALREARQ
jgi:integrase